jgi:trk system potassium uptake protein
MHIVIGGCGRLGSQLTVELNQLGHTVAIIDKRREAFERLPPGFEGQTVVGLTFDRETLEAAGIRDADAYLATSSGDNSNIVSARIAREHYGVERVVARIYDPRRAEIYQRLGIRTFSTVSWAEGQILDALFGGGEQTELRFSDGSLLLVQIPVGSQVAGQRVIHFNEEERSTVVAIDRRGTTIIPGDKTAFQEGDVAHVAVHRDALSSIREQFEGAH